ncbi:MAG: hypothetical protein WBP94_10675 [Rhodomicrobiaceae bacterium]
MRWTLSSLSEVCSLQASWRAFQRITEMRIEAEPAEAVALTNSNCPGCPITSTKVDGDMKALWDAPVHAAAFRWGV